LHIPQPVSVAVGGTSVGGTFVAVGTGVSVGKTGVGDAVAGGVGVSTFVAGGVHLPHPAGVSVAVGVLVGFGVGTWAVIVRFRDL
jgi:hypothetical protein